MLRRVEELSRFDLQVSCDDSLVYFATETTMLVDCLGMCYSDGEVRARRLLTMMLMVHGKAGGGAL